MDSENLILTIPTMEYAPQIRAFRQEFSDAGSMDGTGSLRQTEDPAEWLREIEKYKHPETVPAGKVQGTQFICVRMRDRKIVGMLQVRHTLNAYLEKYGGHIGYSVCPSERRKGYAKRMLRQGLDFCRTIGLTRVLITCRSDNEASRRTIVANGGVYESTVFDPDKKVELERYWVDLPPVDERMSRQIAFALELDKEKNVFRQTHLSGHGRNENDAEHAWHMAVMAYLLREYSNAPVDIARVMLMCLIHDVVEIDAGDTYAYDTQGLQTQKAREDAAKERIFSLLPDDQKEDLLAVFDEFEANETAEAKFAHAMDNFQPLLLNHSNGGSDWRAHGVHAGQVYGRQEKTRPGSERLYAVTDAILKENIEKGNLPRHAETDK